MKATSPGDSQSTYDDSTQNPMRKTKTPSTTASAPRIGPSPSSPRWAKSRAAGVCRMSGGTTRSISSGTATLDTMPGARPATNQLVQVTSIPANSRARSPSSRLAALL